MSIDCNIVIKLHKKFSKIIISMSIDCNIAIKHHKKFSKIIISMSIDCNIVIKLHKSGESNSEIAKWLKMNCTTVWKIIKKFQEI